jgi:hypothetical protein
VILWYRALCLLLSPLVCAPLFAATWYVRPDGGTRYSTKVPAGQCDGTADAPYPGKGTNRHCAFKDVRYLYADGSYAAEGATFPAWGWIGKGGDTYLIRGSIAEKVSYRIGANNNANSWDGPTNQYWGQAGDPYGSGLPVPPSGTAEQHTRILGENYKACHSQSARTQLHGGYGVASVLSMQGASYVDIACLDITDFSACGKVGQANACNSSYPGTTDFASNGIHWSNTSTNDTLTDVRIHGLALAGMIGPTGTGVVFSYLDLLGNAASGWNADNGDGTSGTGTLLVENYKIGWNGCAEQYPIVDANPYADCTDDESGGYGDGFGTATAASNPAWNVNFDHGEVFNNTQDGLDALHIYGNGSSMSVSHTLAYGNMGQQIKVGGAAGIITDNQVVTNCNALRQAIPGTPAGYNAKLSDFCRAADSGVVVTVNDRVPLKFTGNTIYSASATAFEIECADAKCGSSSKIDFRNNIFIGFMNNAANGYPSGGRGEYSNPIYIGSGTNPFRNPGSLYSGNVTYHANHGWRCPASGESKALCGDPHLVDETWHIYGYGNMAPSADSRLPGRDGATLASPLDDPAPNRSGAFPRHPVTRAVECLCAGVLAVAAWQGIRYFQSR